MPEYVLINRKGSGGLAVEAALAMHGAPFRVEALDLPVSTPLPESFRATNPWRQIPVLDLPDGTRMTESGAMLVHLAETFPDAGVAPRPGTVEWTQFLRWVFFLATSVYTLILQRTYPDRMISDESQHDAVRLAANRRMRMAFEMLERELARDGHLVGGRFSTADVYMAMMYGWFDRERTLPRCTALIERVRDDAAAGPVWRTHLGDK
ncbi:MAG: glutathione S-transferase family protein [Minwuia sp.]|uniref:glutathione S-transferase family protein n=1 Tax=Minwuia sp. TaxID=2493630 RepID=UPI003A890493